MPHASLPLATCLSPTSLTTKRGSFCNSIVASCAASFSASVAIRVLLATAAASASGVAVAVAAIHLSFLQKHLKMSSRIVCFYPEESAAG